MNRIIVTESGSTRRLASTRRLPTSIHGNRWNTTWRCCSSFAIRPTKVVTAAPKAPPIISVASQPAHGSPRRRPPSSRRTTPASGSAGTSQTTESASTSALEERDVVGGGAGVASHDGDDDAEPDHALCSVDDEHEEDVHLAADVVQGARERDERQVHGVEHQLDAHEH